MTNFVAFTELVNEKTKHFAQALGEVTGLPVVHFKINDVACLFAFIAASVALHELESGSLAGRLPFKNLSGALTKTVTPKGARNSTLSPIWIRCKKFRSQDRVNWGDLRQIANYLSIDIVELVKVFKKVDKVRHELARQLASIASDGGNDATLFTSEDSASAGVKVDSSAPGCTSPASEDANTPGISPTASDAETSEAPPNKRSAAKRRPSPRNKKRRERSIPKGAREEGVADPKAGP